MKYGFIQAHAYEHRGTRLCQVLQVSRSGFYAWQRRPENHGAQANRALIVALRRSFQSPVFFFELTESPQFSHAQWAYFVLHA